MIELICPIDHGEILKTDSDIYCKKCNNIFPQINMANGEKVTDFRCCDISKNITLTFTIPQKVLKTENLDLFGMATDSDFKCFSREKIRKLYGTKLQKEILFYIDILLKQIGKDAAILDLGCGNGGNKKYLKSLGFHNIISVDYMSPGAEYLVDVHRLPFASESFDMVLTTATMEHFYNPFIAFSEISRVLKKKGMLIASGSFWESWHGDSCFHFTPGGIALLCQYAGLKLSDMWSGWGFIPSIASHALKLSKFKKITYQLQNLFDFSLTFFAGYKACKRHRFRTSGSFGLFAQKP